MSGFIRSVSLLLVAFTTSCATINTPISKTSADGKLSETEFCPVEEGAQTFTRTAAEKEEEIPIFLSSTTKSHPATPAEPLLAIDPNHSVWEILQNNLSLSYDSDHPRISQQRQRYTSNPAYLGKVTKRAEPYLFHIIKSLEGASLPLELIALPVVESAYKSNAKSRHGAEGLWQFIRSTGKQYGLHRTWWYDGRRDTLRATDGAIAYLKHLNQIYDGDWLLSLAAYNAGENAVNRAIRKNRARGLATDYWSLKLPRETMDYVPRFLAVVSILENPDFFEIKLHPVKHRGYFEPVSVAGRTSLTRLAQQLELDKDLVLRMNAGHRRGITPPDQQSVVLLPQEAAALYQTVQSEIAAKIEIAALTHRVQKGETLSHISKHYGIPIIKIKASNSLRGSLIRPGQKLQIPES